jgi:ribose transport system substrate-binding protein
MNKSAFADKTKLLLLLIILFAVLSGCSSSDIGSRTAAEEPVTAASGEKSYPPKQSDTIIAMVPKSLDNPVFLDAKEEGERIGRELGIKVEWLGSMQTDSYEQGIIVESLIRRHVDGIVVSCIDPEVMRPIINKAVNAGIKVATFDSDCPDSNRLFYCGTNNYAAGEACGKALIKALKEKRKDRQPLDLLVMTADEGDNNLNERLNSFIDTARKGGIIMNVGHKLYCRDDINLAGDLLEKYIRSGKTPDVFFSTGGWPLIVPAESLPGFQAWCKNGGTSIVMDTFYPILDAAKKGLADSLVGQDFKKMGELSIRNLYKAIKGNEIPLKFIDTGMELGNKSNYDLLLKGKQRWEIK